MKRIEINSLETLHGAWDPVDCLATGLGATAALAVIAIATGGVGLVFAASFVGASSMSFC